jgi:hypothetical protein
MIAQAAIGMMQSSRRVRSGANASGTLSLTSRAKVEARPCSGTNRLPTSQTSVEFHYAAAPSSIDISLAEIDAGAEVSPGGVSVGSALVAIETGATLTVSGLRVSFIAFRVFLGFRGVETSGVTAVMDIIRFLVLTIPIGFALGLTTSVRPPPNRDSFNSSNSISCWRAATFE